MPTDDFGWTLEDVNVNASARAATAQRQLGEERTRTCAECSHIWLVSEEGPACSSCGWLPTPKARPVAVVSADLQEIDALPCGASRADLQAFYQEALGFYTGRWPDRWAQKPNGGRWWAWSQARERFGIATERMPSEFWSLAPLRAGTATSGWLRSRLIAWARRRA